MNNALDISNKEILAVIELASTPESQAKTFVKLLTGVSLWTAGELEAKAFGADAKSWNKALHPFYTEYKFKVGIIRALDAIAATVAKGNNPDSALGDSMSEIGDFLKAIEGRFSAVTEIPASTIKDIAANAQYWRNGSSNALAYLKKNVSRIHPEFSAEVADDYVPSQQSDAITLIRTIEKLTGRRDINLTELEKEKFMKSNPDEYAVIKDCRKNMKAAADLFVRTLVRKKGGRIKYSEMLHELQDTFHFWPKTEGWDGMVDDLGKLYTLEGDKLAGGRPSFTIVGNPKFDPHNKDNGANYVFYCITSMGTKQYFYRLSDSLERQEERFEAVEDFAEIIDDVRKKWLADLKGGEGKTEILGALVETMYWTSARIGDKKNNVRGEKTFGITTLQGRHVKKQGNNLVFDYMGKMNHRQHHILPVIAPEHKILANLILAWAKEAGEDGFIFDITGKHATPPSNMTVNSYFKSKGSNVTVHKMRHARASRIMQGELKKCPYMTKDGRLIQSKQPDQKTAEEWYKTAATEVGRELGHTSGEKVTPMTAIASYISPGITVSYFNTLKLRVPSWANKLKKDD